MTSLLDRLRDIVAYEEANPGSTTYDAEAVVWGSLPAVLNLIEAAEEMVSWDYVYDADQDVYKRLERAVAVFVSGQEEPTDGAASDPRPDPRTHPEYWTE